MAMTKGKPWGFQEEKRLRKLVEAKDPVHIIAEKMGKSRDAVVKKCKRLGLEVVGAEKFHQPTTTSRLKLPKELPKM
jgi:hypothetical protein